VPPKTPTESYLGFLYALEDVAVYGYVTPLKLKIVLALALTDTVVRDANIISVRPSSSSCYPVLM
jgi:trafficking protein particle complex subunit 2